MIIIGLSLVLMVLTVYFLWQLRRYRRELLFENEQNVMMQQNLNNFQAAYGGLQHDFIMASQLHARVLKDLI